MKSSHYSIQLIVRSILILPIFLLVILNAFYLETMLTKITMESIDTQLIASSTSIATLAYNTPVNAHMKSPIPENFNQKELPIWGLLRDVQEENNLTYVYLFEPDTGASITYIVDASPEGTQCEPGDQETLPEQNKIGVHSIWKSGGVFVSDVLPYEDWGFLKVSSTPIQNSFNRSISLVGCDLELSTIRKRVRTVVWIAVLFSLLSLVCGIWLALITERQLLSVLFETKKCILNSIRGEPCLLPTTDDVPLELKSLNTRWNKTIQQLENK